MAWYAYCLTEQQSLNNGVRTRRPFLLEGIQGVNGAPVLSYPSGEFAVVVSEYDRTAEGGEKLEDKTVLEHARVVSVCFRHGTVLPFRFGTYVNVAIFRDRGLYPHKVKLKQRALVRFWNRVGFATRRPMVEMDVGPAHGRPGPYTIQFYFF